LTERTSTYCRLLSPQLASRLPYGALAFEDWNIAELLDNADAEFFVGLRRQQFYLRQLCRPEKALQFF